jgi:hypothetical protein
MFLEHKIIRGDAADVLQREAKVFGRICEDQRGAICGVAQLAACGSSSD